MKIGKPPNNIQDLNSRRVNKPADPYQKIAQAMEENFLNLLVQQMRKSSPSTNEDSTSSNYYKGLLDSERAKIMAETRGGLGLQKIILDQISPRAIQKYSQALQRSENE
jgi:Rod binding domain-containing protein